MAERRRKTPTKWKSAALNGAIPDAASVAVSDAVNLTTVTTAAVNRQDPTVVSVRGQVSVSRAAASPSLVAISWAVVMMRKEFGSSSPAQTFSPFSTIDLDERNILAMGHVPAPGILVLADDSVAIDRRSHVIDVHVKVSRKLRMQEDSLYFWISSTDASPPGVDDGFWAIGTFRTLLAWP